MGNALKTKRLILRPLQKKDKLSLVQNINDIDICRGLEDVEYPFTEECAEEWIRFNKEMWKLKFGKTIPLGIFLKSEKKIIGGLSLNNYNPLTKTAEIGYWLGKNYWKRGYAAEAVIALLKFAFDTLKLNKITADILSFNDNSVKFIENLGFIKDKNKRIYCKADKKMYSGFSYILSKENFIIPT